MRGIRGHIWGILTMGWLSCAIGLAQSSFVSEITVPDYGKARVEAFIPPRYWPANYIDALLSVDIDNSGNKKLLGARLALDGTLIDAKWVGSSFLYFKKMEYLPDGRLLICTSDWFGVIDPENPGSRWAKRTGLHTATVGRDADGNLVIAVLQWVGAWRVLIFDPDGTFVRAFKLPYVSFPDIGNFDSATMFHTSCCQTSTQILVYDPSGNHFILTSSGGGDFGNKHIVVYAFTAEGDIHWISGIAGAGSDGGCTRGDTIGAFSAGDGSILIFSTCYNNIYLYRINTNNGYLVETPVVLGGESSFLLYPMQTMNYGSVLGYVSDSGSFGTLFTDRSGWRLRGPKAKLFAMATTTATSPVRRLWVLGGSDSRDNNPAALLAFIDIDSWAEYPFSFYPCFESLLPDVPYPLQAVLNRVTTASVQPPDNSPPDYYNFPIEDARIQVTQRCVVCVPSDGDVDGNGCVDDADLLAVLFAFGSEGPNPADVSCDGVVDDADLLIVLFNFGTGC